MNHQNSMQPKVCTGPDHTGHMVYMCIGTEMKGLTVGSTRPSFSSKNPKSYSIKVTTKIWSSTSRIPTSCPAKARLKLIFLLSGSLNNIWRKGARDSPRL